MKVEKTEQELNIERYQWAELLKERQEMYKSIPMEIQRAIVNKDYRKMLGRDYDGLCGTPFVLAFENANAEFSATIKRNIIKKSGIVPGDWVKLLY